jgi:hypothetical protein
MSSQPFTTCVGRTPRWRYGFHTSPRPTVSCALWGEGCFSSPTSLLPARSLPSARLTVTPDPALRRGVKRLTAPRERRSRSGSDAPGAHPSSGIELLDELALTPSFSTISNPSWLLTTRESGS